MAQTLCVSRVRKVLDSIMQSEPVVAENYPPFPECEHCSSDDAVPYCVTYPFHAAAMLGELSSLKKAAAKQQSGWQEKYDSRGFTVLHCAIVKGNLKVISWLLGIGANPNMVTKCESPAVNTTALYQAVCLQDINRAKIIVRLLKAGADPCHPQARDPIYGTNCLHNAAFFGEIDAVRALLNHGVDTLELDAMGNTAMQWAIAGMEYTSSPYGDITVVPNAGLFRHRHGQIIRLLKKYSKCQDSGA